MKLAMRFCLGSAVGLLSLVAIQAAAEEFNDLSSLPKDFFPLLTWDLPQWSEAHFSHPDHGLSSLPACGFNTAAFVRPQHLPQVEALNLKCILAPKEFPVAWRTLSDEQIVATVKKLVDEAGGGKSVLGFFLADEPGAPDFPALAKAVAAVKKLAPGKLAYINLFPDYATLGAPDLSQLGTKSYTEYLEQYVAIVHPQFISYDNYRIPYSFDQKDAAIAASYYGNLLEVRRVALANHLPFWFIVASCQLLPNIPPPSVQSLLLQANTTLASGAGGLTWYTYFSPGYHYTPIDKDGHRSPTWSSLKMVNDQVKVLGPILRPLKSTGVYFTAPLPAPEVPRLPGKWIREAACVTPLMIGEFTGSDASAYAMIVNLSLTQTAAFTLKLQDVPGDVQIVSSVDGALALIAADHSYWLTAGQGVLLKLQSGTSSLRKR